MCAGEGRTKEKRGDGRSRTENRTGCVIYSSFSYRTLPNPPTTRLGPPSTVPVSSVKLPRTVPSNSVLPSPICTHVPTPSRWSVGLYRVSVPAPLVRPLYSHPCGFLGMVGAAETRRECLRGGPGLEGRSGVAENRDHQRRTGTGST